MQNKSQMLSSCNIYGQRSQSNWINGLGIKKGEKEEINMRKITGRHIIIRGHKFQTYGGMKFFLVRKSFFYLVNIWEYDMIDSILCWSMNFL